MKVLKKKTIKEKHQVSSIFENLCRLGNAFHHAILHALQVEHTRTERRVLGRINHPYIVKLHWAFASSSNLHFVLDYCSGGELYRLLADVHKLEEYHASFYAAEIVLALGHLHSIQIVYRDLKPENILLDGEGHVALGKQMQITSHTHNKTLHQLSQIATTACSCAYAYIGACIVHRT